MRTLAAVILLAGLLALSPIQTLKQEQKHTYQCFGYATLGNMTEIADAVIGKGWYSLQGFDQDGDGLTDFVLAYAFMSGRNLRPFPELYFIYRNTQGTDVDAYVDMTGNGRCQDIVPKQKEKQL